MLAYYAGVEERTTDTRFNSGTEIGGPTISTSELRRWITTIDGECPRCGRQSLVEHVDFEVTTGCLGCGWKDTESIDRALQKAYDDLMRTLERIKRKRRDLEDINKVLKDINKALNQFRERVDSS